MSMEKEISSFKKELREELNKELKDKFESFKNEYESQILSMKEEIKILTDKSEQAEINIGQIRVKIEQENDQIRKNFDQQLKFK